MKSISCERRNSELTAIQWDGQRETEEYMQDNLGLFAKTKCGEQGIELIVFEPLSRQFYFLDAGHWLVLENGDWTQHTEQEFNERFVELF